ncbi:50S ribosomal protein L32 [Candidatus Roizmanbacteria bacterium CG09_land_8_20_14_0_10_41_9]|uniref:Large ribosomal subunit protein bL32 n=1 Tax=Candidatus Roizmanbacteria bacterium CG09_land_8_20_14_0_10_41_9 TaxID=1974850 RepID=A0A2H0WSQ7_9BACT|nr:MAG: 50S ribosomal protein L32 [Candidatus Roizmanbacteria bacterium CG09_land_8_20_14_0_10_41_9]
MAPLPKRKHSTQRKGKRMSTRTITFKNLVPCTNCQKPKLPHKTCKHCRK